VDSFLLQISSSVVRDIYQRTLNPHVSSRTVRWLSPTVTLIVGAIVTAIAFNPPALLQFVIIFASSGLAAGFLMPMAMALFWRRSTAAGAMASMAAGVIAVVTLSIPPATWEAVRLGGVAQWLGLPHPLGVHEVVWGLAISALAGWAVSLATRPPETPSVRRLFGEALQAAS